MSSKRKVAIIGAGLAGCEAAWYLIKKGIPVVVFEMRPKTMTPAHQTDQPAELVCSNSFKSLDLANAHGLLKAELAISDSLVIQSAKIASVPAGTALAVDRSLFSSEIKKRLQTSHLFELRTEEIKNIEELKADFTKIIVAAGPLMSDSLADSLKHLLQDQGFYFYDAIAPVVHTGSINMDIAFKASRYDKGDADYINCPMTKEEYLNFVEQLITAKKVPFKDFEQAKHFEGCLPVEVMAERGIDSLSYGPMKPVGLIDPRSNKQQWAVLQLRQENQEGTLYNMVGCQTRMIWPEQKRIFRMIPGLEECEFARLGSMHRNTYVNAPLHLNPDLSLKCDHDIYLAGQITGVEGYTESTAMGLWAAIHVGLALEGKSNLIPDTSTMIGSLVNYLQTASPQNFQPMNANFGLLKNQNKSKVKNKKEKRNLQSQLALKSWEDQFSTL